MKLNIKKLYSTNSKIQTAIVLAIFIVINIMASSFAWRWDITQGKDFSISETSKNIIKQLDDLVTIKAYFTEDLPGRLVALRQQVDDILAEYKSYSGGNINIEFVDPSSSAELEQETRTIGIPPLQFSAVEQDKYQVSTGYLGLAISYNDNTEVIPVVQDISNLEYDLTNTIKKVTSDKKLTIAFTTGHGELNKDENYQQAVKYLEKQYEVKEVDLNSDDIKDITTLIIAQPTQEFDEKTLYKIDQFIMGGGSVLAMIDGVKVGDGLSTEVINTKLDELLSYYGIKENKDLVLDVSSDMASFSSGFVQFLSPYPFFVKAISNNMNNDSPLVNHLESATFPWISSLEISNDSIIPLIKTTNKAWIQNGEFNLDPQQNFNIADDQRGVIVLAAARFGNFDSYFSARTAPIDTENKINSTDSGRLIVVGDAEFAIDGFLRRNGENLVLFSNMVDGLTQDLDLVSIRSKSITDRPLQEISYAARQTIKYLNIFLPTLLLIIYGFIRLYIRRKETRIDVL